MDNTRDRLKNTLDAIETNIDDPTAQLEHINEIIDMLALPARELVPLLNKFSKTGKANIEFYNNIRPNYTIELGDKQTRTTTTKQHGQ